MSDSSWSRIRLRLFAYVASAVTTAGSISYAIKEDEDRQRTVPDVILFGGIVAAALIVLLIIFDVVYHAAMGKGQACRTCGHIRQMKPFRVYGSCPKCGAG